MTSHQERVKCSLERINVPAWYSGRQERQERQRHVSGGTSHSYAGPQRWRSSSARPGWRRDGENFSSGQTSRENSRCSTPCSRPVYHSSYTRWSTSKLNYIAGRESCFTTPGTSPAHSSYSIKSLTSNTNSNSYRPPYMGWRSQEKLKSTTSSTSLVTTPAQRLAVSSIKKPSTSPRQSQGQDSYDYFKREKAKPKHDNTALHESIKQVTGAIDDFCKSSKRSRRPLTSKGTYEGLMEAKQFHTGGHLWMESSFLPTKSNLRASSARARLEGFNLRNGGVRLEDQIF